MIRNPAFWLYCFAWKCLSLANPYPLADGLCRLPPMKTADLQTLLSLVQVHGANQIRDWMQNNFSMGGTPDEEIVSFLASRDVDFDDLSVPEQDRMRDAYLEGVKDLFRQRLANAPQIGQDAPLTADRRSYPSSLFSRMEAALRAAAKELDHFHRTGQPTKSFMQSETLILGLGDLVAELNRLPASPSPEKPVVQPTGSDSAGLLEEAGSVLEHAVQQLDLLRNGFRSHQASYKETTEVIDRCNEMIAKLNA